jgi:hypothetical protein
MIINTISIMPPDIRQHFSRDLLNVGDHWDRFFKKSILIKERANKKYSQGGRQKIKFDELVNACEEIYEWNKAQKAFREAENKTEEKRPDIPVDALSKLCGFDGEDVRKSFSSYEKSLSLGNNKV